MYIKVAKYTKIQNVNYGISMYNKYCLFDNRLDFHIPVSFFVYMYFSLFGGHAQEVIILHIYVWFLHYSLEHLDKRHLFEHLYEDLYDHLHEYLWRRTAV